MNTGLPERRDRPRVIETVPTNQPMPDIARACVNAMHEGHDVELPVAAWRRPGLTKAITAEVDVTGPGDGRWRFVEPQAVQVEGPEAQDMLGWGEPTLAPADPVPAYMELDEPVGVFAPASVALPVAVLPPSYSSTQLSAAPLFAGGPLSQATGMLLAAYAVLAHTQPVMAANLHPAPFGQLTSSVPVVRSSHASALAELADLDGL